MTDAPELVDGGARACGELLLVLAARARVLEAGTHIRLVATDPAAAIDLPAWCHLTGHAYVGSGHQDDGRPHYDMRTVAKPHDIEPDLPWRLKPSHSAPSTTREETSP